MQHFKTKSIQKKGRMVSTCKGRYSSRRYLRQKRVERIYEML